MVAPTTDGSIGEAQVDQPEFKEALEFYVDLINDAGEDDAANASFNECLAQYQDGKVAMWYDATVAAGLLEADDSPVKGKNGYAPGAGRGDRRVGLAVGAGRWRSRRTSPDPDTAWKYISWATGPEYIKAGRRRRSPAAGRRSRPARAQSTYEIPEYQEAAAAFAEQTLDGDGRRADRQPGHDAAPGPARRAVRRRPRVPGRRQPVHRAVLGGDRRADVDRRRARRLPGHRLAGVG